METPSTTASPETPAHERRPPPATVTARLTRRLRRALGLRSLVTGRWLEELVVGYLAFHEERHAAAAPTASDRPRDDSQQLVRRTCLATSGLGAGAAVTVTAAELSGPTTAIVAAPLAGVAVGADMIARTLLHLRMVCELGELSGIRFGPDDAEALARLYALALGAVERSEPDDPGRELVERVVGLETRVALQSLGGQALGESVLRNVVPFVNLIASPAASWRLTERLGAFFSEYFVRRRALDDAYDALVAEAPGLRELAIEGVWFLFIADGQLSALETALLSGLLRACPDDTRGAVTSRFVVDEAAWLHRLAGVDDHDPRAGLMRVLRTAAAVDAELAPAELAILRAASDALQQPWDVAPIEPLTPDAAPREA